MLILKELVSILQAKRAASKDTLQKICGGLFTSMPHSRARHTDILSKCQSLWSRSPSDQGYKSSTSSLSGSSVKTAGKRVSRSFCAMDFFTCLLISSSRLFWEMFLFEYGSVSQMPCRLFDGSRSSISNANVASENSNSTPNVNRSGAIVKLCLWKD
jgi:hypothetical protein